MPAVAARAAAGRGRVFRGTDALARGDLTRQQLRGPGWRRLLRDVYADAQLPVTHGLYVAAARLVMPAQAVIAGRSAGWLYGVEELASATDPVEVLVADAHRFGPVAGLRIRTTLRLGRADVDDRNGLRTTGPVRTAMDIARTAPTLIEAVTALDLLLARNVVSERCTLPTPAANRHRNHGFGSASCCAAAPASYRNMSCDIAVVSSHGWPSSTTGCGTGRAGSSARIAGE